MYYIQQFPNHQYITCRNHVLSNLHLFCISNSISVGLKLPKFCYQYCFSTIVNLKFRQNYRLHYIKLPTNSFPTKKSIFSQVTSIFVSHWITDREKMPRSASNVEFSMLSKSCSTETTRLFLPSQSFLWLRIQLDLLKNVHFWEYSLFSVTSCDDLLFWLESAWNCDSLRFSIHFFLPKSAFWW